MKKLLSYVFGFVFLLTFVFMGGEDIYAQNTSSSCVELYTNLKLLDRNSEVTKLQNLLKTQGYLNTNPTGYFGALTLDAVIKFQKDNNISPAAGYVGSITRAKIKELSCGGVNVINNSSSVKVISPNGGETYQPNEYIPIKIKTSLPVIENDNYIMEVKLAYFPKNQTQPVFVEFITRSREKEIDKSDINCFNQKDDNCFYVSIPSVDDIYDRGVSADKVIYKLPKSISNFESDISIKLHPRVLVSASTKEEIKNTAINSREEISFFEPVWYGKNFKVYATIKKASQNTVLVEDSSDSNFSIMPEGFVEGCNSTLSTSSLSNKPCPSITLTYPKGGEKWKVGSTQTISWTTKNAPPGSKVGFTTSLGWAQTEATLSLNGSHSFVIPEKVCNSIPTCSLESALNKEFTIEAFLYTGNYLPPTDVANDPTYIKNIFNILDFDTKKITVVSEDINSCPTGATGTYPDCITPNLTSSCVELSIDLKYGDKNNEVTKLQTFLKSKGYFTENPTGFFGAVTEESVIAFQKANNITPAAGYVGSITRAKIKEDCKTPASSVAGSLNFTLLDDNSTAVLSEKRIELEWYAGNNLENCVAVSSPLNFTWNGVKASNGIQGISGLKENTTFTLSCVDKVTKQKVSKTVSIPCPPGTLGKYPYECKKDPNSKISIKLNDPNVNNSIVYVPLTPNEQIGGSGSQTRNLKTISWTTQNAPEDSTVSLSAVIYSNKDIDEDGKLDSVEINIADGLPVSGSYDFSKDDISFRISRGAGIPLPDSYPAFINENIKFHVKVLSKIVYLDKYPPQGFDYYSSYYNPRILYAEDSSSGFYKFVCPAGFVPGGYTTSNDTKNFPDWAQERFYTPCVKSNVTTSPIITLTSTPTGVEQGKNVTLTWSSTNSTSCTASANPANTNWTGTKATSGTQTISNLQNTATYTLTCSNQAGEKVSKSVDVGVYIVDDFKPVLTLKANPASVQSGGSTTLTWSTQNVGECIATGGWTGSKNANGGNQLIANITSPQSFSLTCTGRGGVSVKEKVDVPVYFIDSLPKPVISLTVNPTQGVEQGKNATLTWSSTYANSCTASASPSNSQWNGVKATSGSQLITNIQTTTKFNLICTGEAESTSATVDLGVYVIDVLPACPLGTTGTFPNCVNQTPKPTVILTANPTLVSLGGSTTLTWTSTNANSCIASNSWTGERALNGSLTFGIFVNVPTTYRLTCTGPGGTTFADITVNITSTQTESFPPGCTSNVGFSTTTGQSCSVDKTPRISVWGGKFPQYVNPQGLWISDLNSLTVHSTQILQFCKKWYPSTTSAEYYKSEYIPNWVNYSSGAEETFYSNHFSYRCVGGVQPNVLGISTENINSCTITSSLLMKGMKGEDVRCLQKKLNNKGYPVIGTENGKETIEFGYYTMQALKKFQKDNNLASDGILGKLSREILNN